jgi:hypothetical protein
LGCVREAGDRVRALGFSVAIRKLAGGLADGLREDLVVGLDPGGWAGPGVPVGGEQYDLGDELLDRTDAAPPVRIPNHVSTWFIHDAES